MTRHACRSPVSVIKTKTKFTEGKLSAEACGDVISCLWGESHCRTFHEIFIGNSMSEF